MPGEEAISSTDLFLSCTTLSLSELGPDGGGVGGVAGWTGFVCGLLGPAANKPILSVFASTSDDSVALRLNACCRVGS